jgi:transposase
VDHQPRSGVPPEKGGRDRLIRLAQTHPDWALGFADEVWWSRVARPHLAGWADDGAPLRLIEQTVGRHDPDPKALACYGLLVREWGAAGRRDERLWLRFVDGRPVSGVTTQFLDWCCARLAAAGKTALLLVWDNASWHVSKAVRGWIGQRNRRVKEAGAGVRIVTCFLPSKSPWLNPIEPKWMHGKRWIVEPARLLSAEEIAERVCAGFGCLHEVHLSLPQEVA